MVDLGYDNKYRNKTLNINRFRELGLSNLRAFINNIIIWYFSYCLFETSLNSFLHAQSSFRNAWFPANIMCEPL